MVYDGGVNTTAPGTASMAENSPAFNNALLELRVTNSHPEENRNKAITMLRGLRKLFDWQKWMEENPNYLKEKIAHVQQMMDAALSRAEQVTEALKKAEEHYKHQYEIAAAQEATLLEIVARDKLYAEFEELTTPLV